MPQQDIQRAPSGERIAVVAGLRTPFARKLTAFKDTNAI